MDLDELSTLIFITIDNISEISSSRASMWSKVDRYAHVPVFRFRLKNHENKDDIYDGIKGSIASFKGNFSWTMSKHDSPKSLFIIAPSIYIAKLLKDKRIYSKEDFLNEMSLQDYENMVDKAIEDVPLLASHINKFFGK